MSISEDSRVMNINKVGAVKALKTKKLNNKLSLNPSRRLHLLC